MATLLIDTSSEHCILALLSHGEVVRQEVFLHKNNLSKELMPAIETLLMGQPLDSIAVGTGPGSYTGTRVGVAVARSLAFALQIPLQGFCSLLLFLPEALGTFLITLPSKSGRYFICKGKDAQPDFQGSISPASLLEYMRQANIVVSLGEKMPPNPAIFSQIPFTETSELCYT
ncbi:MAG: tRNA (adenosine(37)-N6)-threonylcarbamoyltransferase complex dimerization subunit type 1 TsaB [Verrucomicrobia bacterium]|nr:tRNA (adenosine(37)-N6)-threonylcarbamoyltransferase complex dimerization subunit type 1 TsaB [Verrucomicrobiota bacterium]